MGLGQWLRDRAVYLRYFDHSVVPNAGEILCHMNKLKPLRSWRNSYFFFAVRVHRHFDEE